jgi:putative redox protein
MKITLDWQEQLHFTARANQHTVALDAQPPLGKDRGMTPKAMLLSALAGCTAMDVAALMNKHRQPLESLSIEAEGTVSSGGHPKVFSAARLVFAAKGAIDPKLLCEAVEVSQTRYCGVSAMLSRAFPIEYTILLNGQQIGAGRAAFPVTD